VIAIQVVLHQGGTTQTEHHTTLDMRQLQRDPLTPPHQFFVKEIYKNDRCR